MGRLNSSQFLKAYRVALGRDQVKIPGHLGFSALEAASFYLPRRKKLIIQISGKRLPGNKSPPIIISENISWPDGGDFGGMRAHMLARLKAHVLKFRSKELPERDSYIEICAAGKGLEEFSEKVCSTCVCPYCTVCPA